MSNVESRLQGEIIKWLKLKGCYVLKAQAAPGIPVGCPDVIALFTGGGWCALEIKASDKAKFQPLQKETVKKLDGMYFSRVVTPSNWASIRKELSAII